MSVRDFRTPGVQSAARRTASPWGGVLLALLVGVALIRSGLDGGSGPPQPTSDSAADSLSSGLASAQPSRSQSSPLPEPLLPSTPTRVRIPVLSLNAPLMSLGLDARRWIESPPQENKNLAGWYRDAATPGQQGTSVVVGHVDNASGPAVFYNLGSLKQGHTVEVLRQDGRTAVFSVYGIEVFHKNDFPTTRVYGDTGRPELRLITCGGSYSRTGGYQGNVVVFARMTGVK